MNRNPRSYSCEKYKTSACKAISFENVTIPYADSRNKCLLEASTIPSSSIHQINPLPAYCPITILTTQLEASSYSLSSFLSIISGIVKAPSLTAPQYSSSYVVAWIKGRLSHGLSFPKEILSIITSSADIFITLILHIMTNILSRISCFIFILSHST